MRTQKPAIILYFTACILAVIASSMGNEMLLLYTKPIVIPAILFYYLSVKRAKFNAWYAIFLLFTFIGDTIVLLGIENQTLYIMVPYVISYLILLSFIVADVRRLKWSFSGFLVGSLVFGMLVAVALTLIQFFNPSSSALKIPVIVYGVILALQAGLAAYHFHVSNNNMSFYMAMTALFNCVSDVFYVIFTLIIPSQRVMGLDCALQIFSYYFVIKYFVYRKN